MKHRLCRLLPSEACELQAAYLHCQNAKTKIRYQAVRLYGTGYTVEQILDICACSRRRLMSWVAAYNKEGITALLDHRTGGNRAALTPEQIEAVQKQLLTYTPAQLLGKEQAQCDGLFWTVADLACLLARDYKVTYDSPTSYRNLLTKCGLSYQRPAKQYKSRSEAKIMDFEEALEKKSSTSLKTRPTP